MTYVTTLGSDITTVGKKGYLSLRRKKQFAMLRPASTHVDLGLVLKMQPVGGRLEDARTFNALFTHRVRLLAAKDMDREVRGWLRTAYDAAS